MTLDILIWHHMTYPQREMLHVAALANESAPWAGYISGYLACCTPHSKASSLHSSPKFLRAAWSTWCDVRWRVMICIWDGPCDCFEIRCDNKHCVCMRWRNICMCRVTHDSVVVQQMHAGRYWASPCNFWALNKYTNKRMLIEIPLSVSYLKFEHVMLIVADSLRYRM